MMKNMVQDLLRDLYQRNVETLIANAIINDKIKFGEEVNIDEEDNKLVIRK